MKTKKAGFRSMDEYISTFPNDVQKKLEELRATIKVVAPRAEETMSYQMAAFKLDGRYITHFAAWKKHIGIYPIPAGDAAFQKEIIPYKGAKTSLNFSLDKPLPLKLISKIVKFRIAETLEDAEIKSSKKK